MAQQIFGMGLGATGIVGVLILAGIFLKLSGASPEIGDIAIKSGVFIGIVFGVLGIFGVMSRMIR